MQEAMVKQGDVAGAIALGIEDVISATGSKYVESIQQAIDSLPDQYRDDVQARFDELKPQ
jgi:hypothetical protein